LLICAEASADCAGEVTEAWRQLLKIRQWRYRNGVWSRGGEYGSTSDRALALHWVMFAFEMPGETGKGIESAACLGPVVMAGREYSVYEYSVRKSAMIERHRSSEAYVDTLSGLPAREEVEREVVDKSVKVPAPRSRHSTEFRPDPLLKIEP